MMPLGVSIIGLGWVTAAGIGRGRRGSSFAMPTGSLPTITRKDVLDRPSRAFSRTDAFARTGLAAVSHALRDADLLGWSERREIGVVLSTVYGSLRTDLSYSASAAAGDGSLASPKLFAYTIPNTFLGDAGLHFGLSGIGFVVTDASTTGLTGLGEAIDCMAGGQADTIVAGHLDLAAPEGYEIAGEIAPGAVFFVLDRGGLSAPSYGLIERSDDHGLRLDGRPIEGLVALVRSCLTAPKARTTSGMG